MPKKALLHYLLPLLFIAHFAHADNEARQAISVAESLAAASGVFANKYGQYPGDISNKTAEMLGLGKGGDGDKKISKQESELAKEHLMASGLITKNAFDDYSTHFAYSEIYGNHVLLGSKDVSQKIITPELVESFPVKVDCTAPQCFIIVPISAKRLRYPDE